MIQPYIIFLIYQHFLWFTTPLILPTSKFKRFSLKEHCQNLKSPQRRRISTSRKRNAIVCKRTRTNSSDGTQTMARKVHICHFICISYIMYILSVVLSFALCYFLHTLSRSLNITDFAALLVFSFTFWFCEIFNINRYHYSSVRFW